MVISPSFPVSVAHAYIQPSRDPAAVAVRPCGQAAAEWLEHQKAEQIAAADAALANGNNQYHR
jgi:hypothetical protein